MLPVRAMLFSANGRTHRRTDTHVAKSTVASRSSANASKPVHFCLTTGM